MTHFMLHATNSDGVPVLTVGESGCTVLVDGEQRPITPDEWEAVWASYTASLDEQSLLCTWTPVRLSIGPDEEPDAWHTECGDDRIYEDGTLADHNIRFCPGCGRRVEEQKP